MSNYDTEYLLSEVYGLNPPALKNRMIHTRRMDKITNLFEAFKEEFMTVHAQTLVRFNGYKNKCAYFKTNESELSVRTSLTKRPKVYPQFIGRASKKQFLQKLQRMKGFYKKVDEFIRSPIGEDAPVPSPTGFGDTHSGLKQFIIDNIGDLVNLYLDCLMNTKYTLWIYGKNHNEVNYIIIDSDNLPDLSDARLVRNEAKSWNQYNTVKWNGTSIGEIRITKKGRIEFGFFIHKLINIIHREVRETVVKKEKEDMGQIIQAMLKLSKGEDEECGEAAPNEVPNGLEDSESVASTMSASSWSTTSSPTGSVLSTVGSMGSMDTIGTVIDVSSDDSYNYIHIGDRGGEDSAPLWRVKPISVFCTVLKNIFCFINVSIPLFILFIFLVSEYEKNT